MNHTVCQTQRKAASLLISIILSGCATQQTAVPIRIEVPINCIAKDDVPVKPIILADDALIKLSDGDLVLVISSERIALKSYANLAEAALQSCINP